MGGLGRYAVELVATFFLTLVVLGAAAQEPLTGAVAIGATVALVLWVGGQANPVVTLAAVLARRTAAGELLPFWAAQVLGALVAAALARWVTSAPAVSPQQGVGAGALLVVEALSAFALCYAVLHHASGSAERAGVAGPFVASGALPAAAGLTVVAAAALADPAAAAAFNPAAVFGQVVAGVAGWTSTWPYLLGCPLGAAAAGALARQASSRPG